MLDIRFIRENPEAVQDSINRRGLKIDIAKLFEADDKRRKLIGEIDDIQAVGQSVDSQAGLGQHHLRQNRR